MLRPIRLLLPLLAVLPVATANRGQSAEDPPITYELIINGETFLIQANRLQRLQSREKPGVDYQVALRIAPTQRMKLNTVAFDYDRFFSVQDDRDARQRTARLSHELGFSLLITDLGAPLKSQQQEEALQILTRSVTGMFRRMQVVGLEVSKPHTRKFGQATARGLIVRYRDDKDRRHVCLLYVLCGPKFAATCVAQYLDDDSDDALPLIKRTLDSFRALP